MVNTFRHKSPQRIMFQQIYKPQKIKDEKVRIRTGFERINIDIKRRMKRLGHDPRMVKYRAYQIIWTPDGKEKQDEASYDRGEGERKYYQRYSWAEPSEVAMERDKQI